jgi:hypothetical protein
MNNSKFVHYRIYSSDCVWVKDTKNLCGRGGPKSFDINEVTCRVCKKIYDSTYAKAHNLPAREPKQ